MILGSPLCMKMAHFKLSPLFSLKACAIFMAARSEFWTPMESIGLLKSENLAPILSSTYHAWSRSSPIRLRAEGDSSLRSE